MSKIIKILILVFIVAGVGFYFYGLPNTGNESSKVNKLAFLTASDLQLPAIDGFKEGMEELGYKEGVNIEYLLFNPQGDREETERLAKQIIELAPDLLVPVSTTASTFIKSANATAQIPTVFMDVGNLARLEIENLQHPGGFMTGVAVDNVPAAPKRMEILKEVLPGMKNVAVLLNSEHVSFNIIKSVHDEAGKSLGLNVIYYDINNDEDLPGVMEEIKKDKPDAFMTTSEAIVSGNPKIITKALREARIPSIDFNGEVGVESGYMLVFGITRFNVGKQGARIADKVLRGQSPGNIPVEFAGAPVLDINLKLAKEMGFNIPESLILQARNVLE